MLSNTLRLNFCYLKITHTLDPHSHPKIIGHILKNKQKSKCACIQDIILLTYYILLTIHIDTSSNQIKVRAMNTICSSAYANIFMGKFEKLHIHVCLYISNTFISNVRLKLAKNQADAKQHPEAELLLFENYLHSSSTLSSKNSRSFIKTQTSDIE